MAEDGRLQTASALYQRWSEGDLRVLDDLMEGVQILGPGMEYRYINHAAAAHGQRPRGDFAGQTLPGLFPGVEQTEVFRLIESVLRDGTSRRMENLFTFPDGEQRWFELRMDRVPAGVLVLSLDIEARKAAEARAQRAADFEAIARFGAGVAHDIGNLLQVVQGALDLLGLESLSGEDRARALETATWAVSQGGVLTRRLADMRGRMGAEPVEVDAARVVEELGGALRAASGPDLVIEVDAVPSGRVSMPEGELEEILLNLATNARHAMPDGGRLVLRVRPRVLTGSQDLPAVGLAAGAYALLQVADDGCGMTPEVLARALEPGFSTRDGARGLGLGLSGSHASAVRAGGALVLRSEPGVGTEVSVFLPRVDAAG